VIRNEPEWIASAADFSINGGNAFEAAVPGPGRIASPGRQTPEVLNSRIPTHQKILKSSILSDRATH